MLQKPPSNLFSSEAVSCFHPDKICDQISDAILDECLENDKKSRVACEVFGTSKNLIIGGEITTKSKVDYSKVAREILEKVTTHKNIPVTNLIIPQSLEIATGVNRGGASDQGVVFGYAVGDNKQFLPNSYYLASEIMMLADKKQEQGLIPEALFDKKCMVTLTKDKKVKSIVYSNQHVRNFNKKQFIENIKNQVIDRVLKSNGFNVDYELLFNSADSFVKGGFESDTGLTGRKIIVDTYGGFGNHGGGAFSGKDPTKVDRSGAYMARFVAKNIVANGIAKECLVQVSYAIGVINPISICVRLDGVWESDKNDYVLDYIYKNFSFIPQDMISFLDLTNVKYQNISKYGHFLKKEYNWEKIVKF